MDGKHIQTSRRNVLRAVGISGGSYLGIGFSSNRAGAASTPDKVQRFGGYRHTNHEEVENGEAPEREPTFYEIPYDDWASIEATRDGASRVGSKFTSPDLSFGLRKDDSSKTGLVVVASWEKTKSADGTIINKPDIPYSELSEMLPSTVTGVAKKDDMEEKMRSIPVTVKKRVLQQEAFYDNKYRPIPSGCAAERGDLTDFTIGSPAYDWDIGENVLTTASHCVKRQSGTEVYQHSASWTSQVATSYEYTERDHGDAATCKVDADVTYQLAEEGGYGRSVTGNVSDDKLRDMAYYGENMTKQGQQTGRTEGVVEEVDDREYSTRVITSAYSDGGDSGGPHYRVDQYDDARIGCIHAGKIDNDSDGEVESAYGTTAETIEGKFNVGF